MKGYFLLATFATMTAAGSANAQTFCADRTQILDRLSHTYSEAPAAMGLAASGGVVEVLTSKEGGTWTIIVTTPNGNSCLVLSGEHWEPVKRKEVALGATH